MCSNHIIPISLFFKKMQTLSLLHSFLLVVLTFSSIMVFFSYNPIYSVLFLILSFLSASSILVLFGVEFLAAVVSVCCPSRHHVAVYSFCVERVENALQSAARLLGEWQQLLARR